MITRLLATSVMAWALVASLQPAVAKESEVSTVSAEGRARLRPRPTALRMEIELRKFGATARVALDRLAAGRQRASEKLAKLGADKSRVVIGPPSLEQLLPLASGPSGSRVAVHTGPAVRFASRPAGVARIHLAAQRGDDDEDRPRDDGRLYMAYQNVTVDWPLSSPEDLEETLLEAHALQDAALEADVAGANGPSELTNRERQLLEAAAELQFDPGYEDGLSTADLERPAEALFRYVARLTPEQSRQLQATAFAQAKERAATLAEVTGAKLGGIFDVSCSHDVAIADDDYALASSGHFSGKSTPQRGWRSGLTSDETTGLDLGSLQFTVVLSVMFYLE